MGFMKIVNKILNEILKIILYPIRPIIEPIIHLVNSKNIQKGFSSFKDKLNDSIASELLTIFESTQGSCLGIINNSNPLSLSFHIK